MIKALASYILVTLMIILGFFGRIMSPWINIPLCLLAVYFGWNAYEEKGNFYSLFAIFYAFCYMIWVFIAAIM